MKKLAWVCIAALIITAVSGCGRSGKLPEGLIKKDTSETADEVDDPGSSEVDEVEAAQTQGKPVKQQAISLYFWNKEDNQLVCETRNTKIPDEGQVMKEAISALIKGPVSEDLKPVMPSNTKLLGLEQTDNIVTVNLSSEFLKAEDPLVARAALVNTLTELENIKFVKINVNGKELTADGSQEGEPLGVLSRVSNNIDELLAAKNRVESGDVVKEVKRELFFRDFRGGYLLSEIRSIKVKNGGIARAIVEELIRGPVDPVSGLYPVIPQGTQLLDINLLEGRSEDSKIVALYFSKELKAPFVDGGSSRGDIKDDPEKIKEKSQETKNKEAIILSAIVYSLSDLPQVESIKIFYEDRYGNYTDAPLSTIDLRKPLTTRDFPDKLGRKIKVYFSNSDATKLVADYRAMSRKNPKIANTIIDEIILGPREDSGLSSVLPENIEIGDIKVKMDADGTRAIVDLPGKLDGNQMGSTGSLMALYAIVNSLTDPTNTPNIKEVQFLVNGKVTKTFGNLEFSEPFIRNPAIIEE